MTERSGPSSPTPAEVEILRILWKRPGSTVREVYEQLHEARGTVYTTVLKTMQIMTEKGLVVREEQGRGHAYSAAAPQAQVQRRMVNDLVDRVFGGAAQDLVMHALTGRRATTEEIAEIRALLDRMESGTEEEE